MFLGRIANNFPDRGGVVWFWVNINAGVHKGNRRSGPAYIYAFVSRGPAYGPIGASREELRGRKGAWLSVIGHVTLADFIY